MLASGTACVAEIAKLPAHTASNSVISTNFADIIPKKSKLDITLNLKFDEINDPKNICMDITGKGKWGNGDVRVSISRVEDLDYVLSLIQQALDKVSEE